MCKDGKGIDGNETGGVVTASLQSPVDFGWQKNSGGRFKETVGTAVWGAQWRHSHPDKIQAVLVIGIPTDELPDNPGTTFLFLSHAGHRRSRTNETLPQRSRVQELPA